MNIPPNIPRPFGTTTTGTPTQPINPGETPGLLERLKDSAAAAVQTHAPLTQFKMHMVCPDFYNGHPETQFCVHAYISRLSDDLKQCLLFDSDTADAKLIGVEYVVSSRLFAQLPDEEKKLWHSHAFEAKQGLVTAPGVPRMLEHPHIEEWGNTYGKNFHFWQIDKPEHTIPLGVPQLMMAPVSMSHVNAELMQRRDRLYSISTEEERASRASLNIPTVTDPKADLWTKGEVYQLRLERDTTNPFKPFP